MSLNVDNLLHWPTVIERWGPAWGYSNFNPESLNGWLKRRVYGRNQMMTKSATRFIQAKTIAQDVLQHNQENVKKFCLSQLQIP